METEICQHDGIGDTGQQLLEIHSNIYRDSHGGRRIMEHKRDRKKRRGESLNKQ